MVRWIGNHRRLAKFAAVGGVVAASGYVVLFALIELIGLSPHASYLLAAVGSIELSFLMNGSITWADRKGAAAVRPSMQRFAFHATRWATVPLNQVVFSLLVFGNIHWAIANALCIAATAAVNYRVGDRWIFRGAVA